MEFSDGGRIKSNWSSTQKREGGYGSWTIHRNKKYSPLLQVQGLRNVIRYICRRVGLVNGPVFCCLYCMPNHITTRTLAEMAGVSTATVSRALNGDARVAARTRSRIEALARKHGYRPNPILASLAAGRFKKSSGIPIAFLHQDVQGPYDRWARRALYHDELEQASAELGFIFRAVDVRPGTDLRALSMQLYHQGVIGIVLSRTCSAALRWDQFEWSFFSVLHLGHNLMPLAFHNFGFSAFHEIRETCARIAGMRYRRIGACLVRHRPEHPDDVVRRAAWHEARRSQDVAEPFVYDAGMEFQRLADALDAWATSEKPDAVIAFNTLPMLALATRGWDAPNRIGVACLQLSEQERKEGVSGWFENRRAMAKAALSFLEQMVRRGDRGIPEFPLAVQLCPCWVQGKSLPVRRTADERLRGCEPSKRNVKVRD